MKLATFIFVLFLATACFGEDVNELQADINYDGSVNFLDFAILSREWLMTGESMYAGPDWIDLEAKSNAILVSPQDDLAAKYEWLKSSDRDEAMGALSDANRRTLILAPGTYILTATLMLDTDYVDIMGLASNNPDAVIVTGDDSADVVKQTCKDLRLGGFTIKATASHRGLVIDCADKGTDLELEYQYLYFFKLIKPGIGTAGYSNGDNLFISGGTGDANSQLTELAASVHWGDDFVYARLDMNSASIDGTGVAYHFLPRRSLYHNMRFITGTGANDTSAAVYGATSIGGTWRDCEAYRGACWVCADDCGIDGNFYHCGSSLEARLRGYNWTCFNMGPTGSLCCIKGIFERCYSGRSSFNARIVGAKFYDCQAGTVSFGFGGTFSGEAHRCSAESASFGGSEGGENGVFTGYAENCTAGIGSFGTKPNTFGGIPVLSGTVKDCVQGSTAGYSSGVIDFPRITTFSGRCINSHPWAPSAYASDANVYEFDSGHTYTNTGASGAVTFTLPAAVTGLKYTFIRTEVGTGADVFVTPQSDDAIVKMDGSDLGNGKYYGNTSNAYGEFTIECRVADKWQVVREIGVWVGQ